MYTWLNNLFKLKKKQAAKRDKQFGHTDLFRYFKIFNKCIDFGCFIFIVVHGSWGPAPEYWMLTQNFEVDIPYCFLILVLRTGTNFGRFRRHNCHILVVMIMPYEALDFTLVWSQQDCGHRTSRLILLLEMMLCSSLHFVTSCIPLVNLDRATSWSAECLEREILSLRWQKSLGSLINLKSVLSNFFKYSNESNLLCCCSRFSS